MKNLETISPDKLVTATGGVNPGVVDPIDDQGGTPTGRPRPPGGPTIYNPRPQDIFGPRFPR